MTRVAAVIFDIDGVIVDGETWWAAARRDVAARHGIEWTDDDERRVKGANSREWATAIAAGPGGSVRPEVVEREVVEAMIDRYRRQGPPVIEAGIRAVRRLGAGRRLAVASSGHPAVIEVALAAVGLRDAFDVVVSADEVDTGKPSPDVYLEAARRLGIEPAACLVIEDSITGVEAARSAGMRVVWVADTRPGDRPPAALAVATLDALDEAAVRRIEAAS